MDDSRPNFLIHNPGDCVGIATEDLTANITAIGKHLDSSGEVKIYMKQDVPLGHKISLCDIGVGGSVVEYGHHIGNAIRDIHVGDHVHVHNLKSARW